jgi:spore germination cell wall hydrolase CwlJ-like protein
VANKRWPNTVKEVVYQPHQYEGMAKKLKKYSQTDITKARKAVAMARWGVRPCGDGVYWFHNQTVIPYWSKFYVVACIIEGHTFYREN